MHTYSRYLPYSPIYIIDSLPVKCIKNFNIADEQQLTIKTEPTNYQKIGTCHCGKLFNFRQHIQKATVILCKQLSADGNTQHCIDSTVILTALLNATLCDRQDMVWWVRHLKTPGQFKCKSLNKTILFGLKAIKKKKKTKNSFALMCITNKYRWLLKLTQLQRV